MPIVLASGPVSPPVSIRQWKGLGLIWVGPDGSEWDLTDWRTGIGLVRGGVKGLQFPKITKYRSTSRVIPGDRLRGWRAESRDVAWSIYLWGDGSDEWLARQRAFFDTIRPDQAGMWKCTAGDETRTLRCTGVFDDGGDFDVDPYKKGWALYGVELEAVQPYWQGDMITFGTWQNEDPVDFIDLDDPTDLDYHPSVVSTTGDASATNPGDVEIWPVWTVEGPWDAGVVLGIAGVNITVPFAILDGQTLVIDTDPRHPTATRNGVDATAALGLQSYATIPPKSTVPLTITAVGTGAVTASGTPLYLRAF